MARRLLAYADTSVIGGCEDDEFREPSVRLWDTFTSGRHRLALSALTARELEGAPPAVRAWLDRVPAEHLVALADSDEATDLAQVYLGRGIVGPGSTADAMHVALASVARVDVIVSWNFRHIVNLGRIRLFHAINLERGYDLVEIRSPREVLDYD